MIMDFFRTPVAILLSFVMPKTLIVLSLIRGIDGKISDTYYDMYLNMDKLYIVLIYNIIFIKTTCSVLC